jgi:hypothetical protein
MHFQGDAVIASDGVEHQSNLASQASKSLLRALRMSMVSECMMAGQRGWGLGRFMTESESGAQHN